MSQSNVLIRKEMTGPGYYAVLADFGVSYGVGGADIRSRSQTTRGQRTNDAWLSPELMVKSIEDGSEARVSQNGDIWAFGCVLLEVL